MANDVRFLVGKQQNLNADPIEPGKIHFALSDDASTGTIYLDVKNGNSEPSRIQMCTEATVAEKDKSGTNLDELVYELSIEGQTITAKKSNGGTANKIIIPDKQVNVSLRKTNDNNIYLMGTKNTLSATAAQTEAFASNNIFIDSAGALVATTFKGSLTGKASSAAEADVANSVSWNNVANKPNPLIELTNSNNTIAYKLENGASTTLGTFAPLDSTGKIDIGYLPASAIERMFTVGSVTEAEQLLESGNVEVGDVIHATSSNEMFYVTTNVLEPNKLALVIFAAGTATKARSLETAVTLKTNLESTAGASFNGSTDANIGVYGTLPLSNGGTGATTAAGVLTNLGITATATEINYLKNVSSNIQTQLNNKANNTLVSLTANGLMSSSDKSKLDGLESIYVGDETDITTTALNADTLEGYDVAALKEHILGDVDLTDISIQIQEALGGVKIKVLSQEEYDALIEKDATTLYCIYEEV